MIFVDGGFRGDLGGHVIDIHLKLQAQFPFSSDDGLPFLDK